MKRRFYRKSDLERLEVKRLASLRNYKNGRYVPPERTILDLLNLYFPSYIDNLEEECWNVCYGENADAEAKEMVKAIRRNVNIFLMRYEAFLKKTCEEDELLKNQLVIDKIQNSNNF